MNRNLKLTSPNMKGGDISYAQKLLTSQDFYHGPIDGIFGEKTANATLDAKKSFGYISVKQNQVFDSGLEKLLVGMKKPSPLMKVRASVNTSKSVKVNDQYHKAIDVALNKIGVKESPADSNIVEFSKWYGVIGPWCSMFVTFCITSAGRSSFKKGQRYSYVPYITNDAKAKRNGLSITNRPKLGSIVTFDWEKDGTPDHVGFFLEWTDDTHTSFYSVEGNTSSSEAGSQSNGGEVAKRLRYVSNVYHFVDWS